MPQRLARIGHNVWILPHHPDRNRLQATVGVIAGHEETVLVDAGNSPNLARSIMALVKEEGLPPISQVIYTHHHWDHVFGAQIYGVPAVAHERCRKLLGEMSRKAWGDEALRVHERNPDLILDYSERDWTEFEIVLPTTTFSQSWRIEVAPVALELQHVGGDHAPDSIVVKVVAAGVMFLGDCYYPENHTDHPISTGMLADLVDDRFELYVDGHRKPYTRSQIERIVRLYRHRPRTRQMP